MKIRYNVMSLLFWVFISLAYIGLIIVNWGSVALCIIYAFFGLGALFGAISDIIKIKYKRSLR